ncbi:MAG: hypothetical protein LUD07_11165 [Clostridiales bacterium]|nr:hypothetical protein [Clostridiales bacterium]
MLQYVDTFACSWSQESGNVVIHFMQKEPIVEEGTNNITEITNPVSSIIMNKDGANALFSLLQDVCKDGISCKDKPE